MIISTFIKSVLTCAAIVAFAFSSYGQEVTFAKANITVSGGVLTIDGSTPAAPGMMFKFGSIVGVNGFGKRGQEFDPKADVLFDPTDPAHVPYADWGAVPYTKEGEIIHNQSNVLLGKGDPCRLVGLTKDQIRSGKVDNGKWRLPTRVEYEWFIKKYVDPDGEGKHNCWVEKPAPGMLATNGTFFPASGYRYGSDGTHAGAGYGGSYWSNSSYTTTSGWLLIFSSDIANQGSRSRSFGFTVRCVAQ